MYRHLLNSQKNNNRSIFIQTFNSVNTITPLKEKIPRAPVNIVHPPPGHRAPLGKQWGRDVEWGYKCKAIMTLSWDTSWRSKEDVYRLKNFLHSIFRPVIVELFVWAHNSCLRAIVYAPPSILHFSIPSTRNSRFHAFPFVEQHFIHASSSSHSWYIIE